MELDIADHNKSVSMILSTLVVSHGLRPHTVETRTYDHKETFESISSAVPTSIQDKYPLFRTVIIDNSVFHAKVLVLDRGVIVGYALLDSIGPSSLSVELVANNHCKSQLWECIESVFTQIEINIITRLSLTSVDDRPMILRSDTVTTSHDSLIFKPEFYPTLPNPKDLWEAFDNSSSNVLVFSGPYGTGKSSFTSEMIKYRKDGVRTYIVDDSQTATSTALVETIRDMDDGSIVIFEDADKVMLDRKEGNEIMSAILNLTSGIIAKRLKLLFITNLENMKEVDGALLRSGRTFRHIAFPHLTPEQAIIAFEANGVGVEKQPLSPMPLSDVLTNDGSGVVKETIGFV